MIKQRFLSLGVVAVAALIFSGCETAGKKTAADSEYEYVTPLGSNIPVRVKKGQQASNGVSPTANVSGEQLNAGMRSGGGNAPVDRAGSR